MTKNIPEGQKEQFYKQICTALIRRLGGSCVVTFDELERPAEALANRRALNNSGIEFLVMEIGDAEPKEIPFQ